MTPVEDPQDEVNTEPSVAGDYIEHKLQVNITQTPKEFE